MRLSNGNLNAELTDGRISISFAQGEPRFQTILPLDGCQITDLTGTDEALCFTVHISTLTLRGELRFVASDALKLTLSGEGAFSQGVAYPPALQAIAGDIELFPIGEGFAFPVDDPSIELRPAKSESYCGGEQSMYFTSLVRGESWIVAAAENGLDASTETDRDAAGLLRTQVRWIPERGEWGYARAMYYFLGQSGGIAAAMRRYRQLRQEQGYLVPLTEKRRRVKNVDQLVGAANVWLWHPNAMNALYDPSPDGFEVDNRENIRRIAGEMKAAGMERLLWGLFFYEDTPAVSFLQDEMGWLASHYEVYKDVIQKPFADHMTPMRLKRNHMLDSWPEDIATQPDGSLMPTWKIKGTDGQFYDSHALCDMMALKRAMNRIPEDVKKNGWKARFIDTTAACEPYECYNPAHAMSRRDSNRYRANLLQFLSDIGLVNGSETATECLAPYYDYNEGGMSPVHYRMPDAGRRMATILRDADVPATIPDYMLNPRFRAPLWELVFHDCMVSYWYWGDSAVSCPEYIHQRDLFCQLYGVPEMYSLSVDHWEELKALVIQSYHATADIARRVGYERMMDFRYLTEDRMVQQTAFETLCVTVNFSVEPFRCADGTLLEPGSSRIDARGCEA